ncbi:prolyl oligopeptidase family serine peptidase [Leekyejoonella antrihumi]|nr:prolyl oligopeptidase family serine peptidase [Leekyejoonella antrihumi]
MPSGKPPAYPPTPLDNTVDELAGVTFPDGLRWLEGNNDRVSSWDDAQNSLSTQYLESWPDRWATQRLLDQLVTSRFGGVPVRGGETWFRKGSDADTDHGRLECGPSAQGPWRTLVDPAVLPVDGVLNIEWFSPSPDGQIIAYGLTTDGSERNRIVLLNVESGEELPDKIEQLVNDSWTGGVVWLPDSNGFFFTARDETHRDQFRNAIFFHRLGALPPSAPEPIQLTDGLASYAIAQVSPTAQVVVAVGLFQPVPRYRRDLNNGESWTPFVTDVDGTVIGQIVGDEYIAVTDCGAPRSRLVGIPLASRTPNDPHSWREIVPESTAVLRRVTAVGDVLYLTELVDTFSRVRMISLNGEPLGELTLPGDGVVAEPPFPLMQAMPTGYPDEFIFAFSTLTSSWGTYRHGLKSNAVHVIDPPAVSLAELSVESREAVSVDGTRIPYHVVARADATPAGRPRPALMYGYGGFGVPWAPQYTGPLSAFALSGGLYVHTHLRGGGEFGRNWWNSGRFEHKQRGYDDLYAIAEDLISRGDTEPSMLAVTGGSGGGLMTGVAITQRPDLWSVAVPQKPFLDIVGGCREPYGRDIVVGEFGRIDAPDDVRRMATFSPCQLVVADTEYPAIFVDAGQTDTRCPAWHARKFVARLQATNSRRPVLLRVWRDVGHGWSNGRLEAVAQATDWLSFIFCELGMRPATADGTSNLNRPG